MSEKAFKPLLAATLEPEKVSEIKYPVLVSPKLDGIRVIIRDGVAVSRNLKPIRNSYVQSIIGKPELNGLDGEIVVGQSNDAELFRATSSGVMSSDGEPDFTFHVFDLVNIPDDVFYSRLAGAGAKVQKFGHERVKTLQHYDVKNADDLLAMETDFLQKGYEGAMLRDPNGVYKHGRSTFKEGILLKLKRFLQEEAVVIGFQERMHNANEATVNALGHTERSTHKENLVGRGDLGALVVKDIKSSVQFTVGTGFSDAERKEIWENQSRYHGQIITYKFMAYGEYDAPRFPVFKGFRHPNDHGGE